MEERYTCTIPTQFIPVHVALRTVATPVLIANWPAQPSTLTYVGGTLEPTVPVMVRSTSWLATFVVQSTTTENKDIVRVTWKSVFMHTQLVFRLNFHRTFIGPTGFLMGWLTVRYSSKTNKIKRLAPETKNTQKERDSETRFYFNTVVKGVSPLTELSTEVCAEQYEFFYLRVSRLLVYHWTAYIVEPQYLEHWWLVYHG